MVRRVSGEFGEGAGGEMGIHEGGEWRVAKVLVL